MFSPARGNSVEKCKREYMYLSDKVEPGPQPENILDQQIELLPPPSPDRVPTGKSFGDVIRDVSKSYGPGSNVSVTFYGANPRHNMKVFKKFADRWKTCSEFVWKLLPDFLP